LVWSTGVKQGVTATGVAEELAQSSMGRLDVRSVPARSWCRIAVEGR
jgi:hypothetical protein